MKHKQHKENKCTGAMLSQETLKSRLHYDPETGVFTRLVSNSNRFSVGSMAGSLHKSNNSVYILIDCKRYLAHRLAWLYVHGIFPPKDIDHINRDPSDNRICNLRMATHAENHQNRSTPSNNTSGHIGVSLRKSSQKWEAYIKLNSKRIHIGYFTDLNDAISARKAAELKYHTFQHNQGYQSYGQGTQC